MSLKDRDLILGVTGSIAAYKAVYLLRELTRAGARVTVVTTAHAEPFVGALTFRTLSGRPVLSDLFERGAGGLLVARVHLGLGAPVELAGPLGGEHHEHVAIGDVVERLLERWERHHAGTSMSGKRRVNRLVRHRSAWMMVASWSTASFTSRLMIR
jgi:hypothetical protein